MAFATPRARDDAFARHDRTVRALRTRKVRRAARLICTMLVFVQACVVVGGLRSDRDSCVENMRQIALKTVAIATAEVAILAYLALTER